MRMHSRPATLVPFIALLACGACSSEPPVESPEEAIARCTTEFSVDAGYDHVGEPPVCVASPDEPDAECPPVTPEDVQATCAAENAPCDEAFVTRAAAECIARAQGLDDGLDGLKSSLTYNYGHERPIWAVENVQNTAGTEGEVYLLDAIDGDLLERSWWETVF